MFSMPSSTISDIPQEGSSDECPIQLTNPFTVKKLDNLLDWFFQ
jgi:hypothetical protein